MITVTYIREVDHNSISYDLKIFLIFVELNRSPEESTNNITVITLTDIQ
ncbi:MAG TPA: hypothetical protein VN414_06995 [Methanosarcina sp.]|nr:hypothetical protein [Methanosarcina sp.]